MILILRKKYSNVIKTLGEKKTVVFYVFALNLLLLIPATLSPIFRQVFTDDILKGGATEWLVPLLSLMFGVAILSGTVTWMKDSCLQRLAEQIEVSGTSKFIWFLLNSPLGLFYKKDRFQLLSKSDTSRQISRILTRDILTLLANIVFVVFYIIMMLRIHVVMTIVVVALVVFSFVTVKLKDFIIEKISPDDKNAPNFFVLLNENEKISSAGLENIETFKSTASETSFFQSWLSSKIAVINAGKDNDYEKASEPFEELPQIIFLKILLLISAMQIMDREFTVGMYLAFQTFASSFFKPLSEVLNTGELMGKFEKRLKTLYHELSVEADADEDRLPEQNEKLRGYISMKNVNFKYEDSGFELSDINLEITPGKRVAILGDSGAGKTTLIKLLQGMYTPDSGEITIGGINPSYMDGELFASSVGCANQKISIFSATVRDNITLWDESVSDAEVYNAASDACIHSYIAKLSGAYEYYLTEHGKNISGGQKQRIEIARAFLRNPSVVLLDEATSAIDPENRATIEENIIKRGCTIVIVTHVLTHIPDYDEIIILEKGKITGRGKHENLLKTSNFYASLFRKEGLKNEQEV